MPTLDDFGMLLYRLSCAAAGEGYKPEISRENLDSWVKVLKDPYWVSTRSTIFKSVRAVTDYYSDLGLE